MAEEINEESLENLTGTEKSAILMMLLGEDEAAQVLQKLTPREVQHLGTAMYSVTGVDQTTVNAVLDEFLETIKKQPRHPFGMARWSRSTGSRSGTDARDWRQGTLGRTLSGCRGAKSENRPGTDRR